VNLKDAEKNLSQCHFVLNKSDMTALTANQRLRVEEPVTNRLFYDTAFLALFSLSDQQHYPNLT
jgi:hypothetical protein